MAIDTPATVAVLGAGPIGIEAALYARYLGYDVVILEQQAVAAHVRHRGNEPLTSPFAQLSTPLGLAALHPRIPATKRPRQMRFLPDSNGPNGTSSRWQKPTWWRTIYASVPR